MGVEQRQFVELVGAGRTHNRSPIVAEPGPRQTLMIPGDWPGGQTFARLGVPDAHALGRRVGCVPSPQRTLDIRPELEYGRLFPQEDPPAVPAELKVQDAGVLALQEPRRLPGGWVPPVDHGEKRVLIPTLGKSTGRKS